MCRTPLAPHTGSDGPGEGIPAEAALAVFAAWLRERAKRADEGAAGALRKAADEITAS